MSCLHGVEALLRLLVYLWVCLRLLFRGQSKVAGIDVCRSCVARRETGDNHAMQWTLLFASVDCLSLHRERFRYM